MAENYLRPDEVEVPFDDDETVRDGELITDPAKLADPEEQKARAERRKERAAERERERKEQAKELEELRARDAKRERELAELRGFVAGRTQDQTPRKDPYTERLDDVYRRQQEAYLAAQAEVKAGTFNEDRSAHYERIARELETEKGSIHAERVLASHAPQQQVQIARQRWQEKYPEVYGNQRAYQFAAASYERRKALLEPGQEPTAEMVEQSMEEARTQFRLGAKRPPSASERERLSGLPSSGSGGGSNSGGGVVVTKDLRKMATALYSDLPEDEAVKKWASTVGKSLREKKVL